MTNSEAQCANTYGPESGPHTGPPEWAAVHVTGRKAEPVVINGKPQRIEPLCYGHAVYEQQWRKAIGAIAQVQIEHVPVAGA